MKHQFHSVIILLVTLVFAIASDTSEHAALNAEQKELIMQALSGTKIYIENIKAKGLDGTIRDLPSIYYELE